MMWVEQGLTYVSHSSLLSVPIIDDVGDFNWISVKRGCHILRISMLSYSVSFLFIISIPYSLGLTIVHSCTYVTPSGSSTSFSFGTGII